MSDGAARQKLFLGRRIRRLRRDLGLTQAVMAGELGISASYLALIEQDQRPVTAQVVLRLAETYDVDLRTLSPAVDPERAAALGEVAADPLLASTGLGAIDLHELDRNQPEVASAMIRLHEGYRAAREDAKALASTASEGADYIGAPGNVMVEETRAALQRNDNFYPGLEDFAADLLARPGIRADLPQALTTSLVDHLSDRHGIEVQIMPYDVMRGYLRRYDRHRKRLMLSELLAPSGRTFQIALQVGLLEARALLDALVEEARLSSRGSRDIYALTLANYAAGALMMPYDRFHEAAVRLRYDVEVLASRFGASFEQVAHRLTTLRRPGARGVPFFLIRVDRAGNISKRFGGGVFPFARSGGTCPRWRLYEAFRSPRRVVVDLAALPDGETFLTVARTVDRPAAGALMPAQDLVVGLGTEARHAPRIVYGDGIAPPARAPGKGAKDGPHGVEPTPIGITCRLCTREDCNWRAFPPLDGALSVQASERRITPFRLHHP
ncbi:Xre family transcriptional regulator [Hasllibacter halocynthiae]|uniref:Xre family transcriptional regulator n=1 Tax=Hasllibacter halocynthiae TaxID=595589 RepID=A0A2T0X4J5_9RHOB|nr:short-chain fatty acyl-CoA regulator family protein [Hasllibacter halocynthiae]PRY93784.1 Xre family transcriptional regulator [Hasllibacter halocynthiae]